MGKQEPKKRRSGMVELDPDKLNRTLLRLGISKTQFADKCDVSRATVIRAFDGKGIFRANANRIATALGYDKVDDLLRSTHSATASEADTGGEWILDDYLGPWMTASNTIQYRICRMRHRFVAGRLGRGKCYDLLNPSTRDWDRLQDCLMRHPTVCERIGPHPHIAANLATYPDRKNGVWWVVDRWVDGKTLEDTLRCSAMAPERVARLAVEMAMGLSALHAANVIFRELAPNRVLIAQPSGRVVLTEFELAKIVDSVPSVSTNWREDPYRGPEVEGGEASPRADLHSWAKVVVCAACGGLPQAGELKKRVAEAGFPKDVLRLVDRCLSPGPSGRPESVAKVIGVLRGTWPECFAAKENSS